MRIIDIDTLNLFLSDSDIPYQATAKLPASGQRDVYLAFCLTDGNQYIIKVAHYSKYNICRVQREIKILNSLSSSYFPSIVLDTFVAESILEQYYDCLHSGQILLNDKYVDLKEEYKAEIDKYIGDPIQPFYLTIENFVENKSWDNFLETTNERMVCDFVRHCFSGLDLLWSNKIAHRDLKPDNILIRPDNTPVIIDLGIAKSLNEETVDLTPGYFKNPHTIRFASPEQLTDRKDIINYKSDQYSMGLIAYYLLCKGYPFGNVDDIGVEGLVDNMMNFNYTPIADAGGQCCDEFETFITKLIKPEPHQRYRTANTIFETLDTINGVIK